ncbi:2-oxoacid dehydrogenases acyltransferase-domain-containing protein [Melampsora americana]|nr:2-oxoacid dehydrogenases acyltransferase-domain-containing protein [Melampsora americana]
MFRIIPRNPNVVGYATRRLIPHHTIKNRELHASAQSLALSKFSMPAMSPTMTEGGIANWKKKEGDSFAPGDVLLEIETDKATMDVEAQDEGTIAKIIFGDGSKAVPVGKAIAIMCEEGDAVDASEVEKLISESDSSPTKSEAAPETKAEPKKEASKPSTSSKSVSTPTPPKSSESSRGVIFATPAAKRIALEKGIPLGSIKGSGPNGRILESDLSSYSQSSSSSTGSATSAAPSYNDIPASNMRRVIASRLTDSKRNVPHYYLTSEIQMDRVNSLRALFNKAAADQSNAAQGGMQAPTKLSVNDFVIKGVALACADVPEVNAQWHGDFIQTVEFESIDISVAVATPTGLITPVVTNVGARGLNNQLTPSEYQGGGFTISNLGMYGSVSQFTSIINEPQACILAVGGADKKLVIDGSSEKGFKEIEVMKVTLSCDHRVVDGAVGARWLKAFKNYMENPLSFML